MALPKNLNDRKYFSFFQDDVAYLNEADTAVPYGTFVGGQYNSATKTYTDGDPVTFQFDVNGKLLTSATFTTGDIEIGSIEIKDGTTDTRAVVKSDGTDNALVVTQNSLPSLATSSIIYSVDMVVKDMEYSQALPSGTVAFDVKLRGQGAILKYSWSSEGDFMTIWASGSRRVDNINFTGKTIYLKANFNNQIAEIECFTV